MGRIFDDITHEMSIKMQWKDNLEEFDEIYEEVFKPHHYSKGVALLAWFINNLSDGISQLTDILTEEIEE